MTIKQAIEKSIEGGKREYMRKPQDWLIVGGGESVTSIVSRGKTYHVKADSDVVEKTLRKYRWYMKNGYAVTSIAYKRIKMHHLVLGKPPKSKEIDHINRDRLDNRKQNLRFVSSLENGQNTTASGVRKRGNSWEANVCLNYKKVFKSFKTKEEAEKWRKDIKANFIKTL